MGGIELVMLIMQRLSSQYYHSSQKIFAIVIVGLMAKVLPCDEPDKPNVDQDKARGGRNTRLQLFFQLINLGCTQRN